MNRLFTKQQTVNTLILRTVVGINYNKFKRVLVTRRSLRQGKYSSHVVDVMEVTTLTTA